MKRIQIIDALRGFSLAGIVIVHMVEQYYAGMPPEGALAYSNEGITSNIINGLIMLFLRGKFFALFSFLFGLSFFIQMDNAQQKDVSYGGRFLWRIMILFIIGLFHHAFYNGDILTIYAVLAIPLIPFFNWSNKVVWSAILVILLGIPRLVVFFTVGEGPIIGDVGMNPEHPWISEYWRILSEGSFVDVAQNNLTVGLISKADFQLGVFYRAYLTFGFFLAGLWVGRTKFFHDFVRYKAKLKRWMWISLLGFVLMVVLGMMAFSQTGGDVKFDQPLPVIGLHLIDLANVCMTLFIFCAFILAYGTYRGHKWLDKFAGYGRMALTNYVVQSIIGTMILYHWGMGYIGELKNLYLTIIALIIIILQMIFSSWWLSRFRYGPLEWVWRSLTWMEVQKFKV